jgi:RND family efflux transporter MFP subunit|uniref:Efflux RND transporter periplasmic adaptor subunit n=1 Tax=Desulfomonile tiedjei TaxID=2358 RepID=A0A7C4AQ93_9BACT
MNRKTLLLAIVALAVLVVSLVWMQGGFYHKISGGRTTPPAPASTPKTIKVEKITVQGEVTVSGTVVARDVARVSSRINGYILEINVDAGDHVKRGDVLLKIDTKDLAEKEAQAAANLESARADLIKAKNDFERFKVLYEKQSVAKKDYDDALAKYEMAQAAENRAKAALDEAKTNLSYGTVTAPFSGVIGERGVNTGDLASPGRFLMSVYRPDSLELVASAGEQYAPFLKEGTSVKVDIPSVGLKETSKIREVVPQRDEKTRTVTVKVPLNQKTGLTPGLYGTMTFDTHAAEAIAVPRAAIRIIGQLESVNVFEDGQVKVRQVKTGRSLSDNRVEVISGLEPGEEVVVP